MNNNLLKEKTILITGASSGIGAACAEIFASKGANLILCARNIDKLEILAKKLKTKYKIEIITFKTDVTKEEEVNLLFKNLNEKWRKIDILINNAGLALGLEKFYIGDIDDWNIMIDTNIKGLLYFTRNVLPMMINENINGHIINIGSLAGVAAYPNGAVYCATKAAVKYISDGLRMDIADKPIRVTNIQPGLVETNFSVVRFHGDKARADNVYDGIKPLTAEDIADIVCYAASAPSHVQICEVTVTATHQATGGVVHREKK